MLRFNASNFYKAVTALVMGRTLMSERKQVGSHKPSPHDEGRLKLHLKELDRSLKILDARVTQIAVNSLQSNLNDKTNVLTYSEIEGRLSELDARLSDELSLVHLFVLDEKMVKYFERTEAIFGKDFETKISFCGL
jgi:hypothetical protein